MVRSEVAPGPYEGQAVVDRSGQRIGVLERLRTVGHRIVAFDVRSEDGRRIEIARERFLETTRDGLQVMDAREDLLG